MTELERCIDFIVRLADRAAKTKEPSRYGVAHLNADLPRVWSRNYLFADRDLAAVTADELVTETDRILGAAGLTHRKVEFVDEEDVVRQLVENRRLMADAVATRFFAGRVDGEIGSYCELYYEPGIGQIE